MSLLSLPAELRLQIAAYVLEQPPGAGFVKQYTLQGARIWQRMSCRLFVDPCYTSAANLSILLVCRQFRNDFTSLAWQKTIFLLTASPTQAIAMQPEHRLQNVRKLIVQCSWSTIESWGAYPFNASTLKLDHLTIAMSGTVNTMQLAKLLRRLVHVKAIKFLLYEMSRMMHFHKYNHMVGVLLKEDHYQRYDASIAPQVENAWWVWSYDEEETSFTFVALEPKPVMEEKDYMLLMKPNVEQVMQNMDAFPALMANED